MVRSCNESLQVAMDNLSYFLPVCAADVNEKYTDV